MQTLTSAQKRNTASGKNEAPTATPQGDRLLTFREVNRLIGSACKTSHAARTLAARGQIKVIRINERLMRFSEASVRDLIAGRVDPVSRGQVNRRTVGSTATLAA